MKAPRAPWVKREAGQFKMENLLRCAEALQHWPLDRIERAMATTQAELLEKRPGLAGALEMIALAQPHGMDTLAAAIVRECDLDEAPMSRGLKKRLKEFVLLAKMRVLMTVRACPHARRTLPHPAAPVPAVQREMKMPGITISSRP